MTGPDYPSFCTRKGGYCLSPVTPVDLVEGRVTLPEGNLSLTEEERKVQGFRGRTGGGDGGRGEGGAGDDGKGTDEKKGSKVPRPSTTVVVPVTTRRSVRS